MAERGFTLMEMLVALGIAGLLLALGASMSAGGSRSLDLASAARQVAAGLREARATAIAANAAVDFRVDVARGAVGTRELRPLGPSGAGLKLELLTTEEFGASPAEGGIRFYPDGASTGGGVAIALGRRRAMVLVDWLSGNVRVVFDAS